MASGVKWGEDENELESPSRMIMKFDEGYDSSETDIQTEKIL